MGDDRMFTDEQEAQPDWSRRLDEIREAKRTELRFNHAGTLLEALASEYALLEDEGVVDYNLMRAILQLTARASRRRESISVNAQADEIVNQERDIDDMGGISAWMSARVGGPFAQGMGKGIGWGDPGEAIDPGIDTGHANARSRITLDDEQAQPIQPGNPRGGPWLARCDLDPFWYVVLWGGDAYSKSELNRLDVPEIGRVYAGVTGPRSIKAGQYCQYNPKSGHIEACPSPEPHSSEPLPVKMGDPEALNRLEAVMRHERDAAEALRRGVAKRSTPTGSRYAGDDDNIRQFPSPVKGVEDMRDATI